MEDEEAGAEEGDDYDAISENGGRRPKDSNPDEMTANVPPATCTATKSRRARPFPCVLRDMIEDSPDDVLRWTEDGCVFIVSDPELLCSTVLPKYFRHCRLASFQRQLSLYQFRRARLAKSGPAFSSSKAPLAYHHALFARGCDDEQLRAITRAAPRAATQFVANEPVMHSRVIDHAPPAPARSRSYAATSFSGRHAHDDKRDDDADFIKRRRRDQTVPAGAARWRSLTPTVATPHHSDASMALFELGGSVNDDFARRQKKIHRGSGWPSTYYEDLNRADANPSQHLHYSRQALLLRTPTSPL